MRKFGLFLLLLSVLLAACAPAAPLTAAPPTPVAGPTGSSAPLAEPTAAPPTAAPPTPVAGPTGPSAPLAEPTAAPTLLVPAATPAPTSAPVATAPTTSAQGMPADNRQLINGFKVSDPTQVTLAAGYPQLVEFFAFW